MPKIVFFWNNEKWVLLEQKFTSYTDLLEKYLKIVKPKRILEWGPGYSTRIMMRKCPKAEIISYENERRWFQKYRNEFSNKIKHILIEAPEDDRQHTTWKQYTNPSVKEKFDLIFVDGRERVRCMKTANKLLNENGVLILHDSDREYYKEGIELFDIVEKGSNTLCLKIQN